ncbi:MAG: hypothetical protein Q4F17_03950 [Eubacteriales bacterium]|nr:hypothetical protein [Eubacteriales bacterium]
MKNKAYVLNTVLAALVGAACLIAVLVRTFAPNVIIPGLNAVNMTALSLAALVLDYYLAPGAKRCYICIPVLAAVTFGLLPLAACFVSAVEALRLAVLGAVVFTAATWVFGTVTDRLSTGPAAKAAPVVSAIGLYLAAQCFMGIF